MECFISSQRERGHLNQFSGPVNHIALNEDEMLTKQK